MKQLLAEERERVAAINAIPPQPQPRPRPPPAALYIQTPGGTRESPPSTVSASPGGRDSDSRIVLPPILRPNSAHLPHLPPIQTSRGDNSSFPRLPPILDRPPSHPYSSPRMEDRHQGHKEEKEDVQAQTSVMIPAKRARPSTGDRADSEEAVKVGTIHGLLVCDPLEHPSNHLSLFVSAEET